MRRAAFRVFAATLALVPALGAARLLDDFRDAAAWQVVVSDDVRAKMAEI